jgi:hypothetical protein
MLVSITAMAQSQLITGKSIILPPLGIQQNVGNLVDNIILSPNGKYAITTDSGFNETLWSIDAYTGMLLGHIDYPSASPQRTVFYYSLAFGNSSTLYVAQGATGYH